GGSGLARRRRCSRALLALLRRIALRRIALRRIPGVRRRRRRRIVRRGRRRAWGRGERRRRRIVGRLAVRSRGNEEQEEGQGKAIELHAAAGTMMSTNGAVVTRPCLPCPSGSTVRAIARRRSRFAKAKHRMPEPLQGAREGTSRASEAS